MNKPNVLFILADDLGWGDVSHHGSAIRTPSIDRLAQTGVELNQHYVCPVCTPTRVSLMTGRHPGRFGKHATHPNNLPALPDGYYTLASLFRDGGYATGLFGKWHLGSAPQFCPNNYGFDESYGSMAGGVDPYTHLYKKGEHSATWHHNGEQCEARGHVTNLVTDAAIAWISAQAGPWFCYAPFTAVHTPVRAPEEWLDRYWLESYDPDPERDRSFKTYAAYTSHLDNAVSRLIETLKELDQINNTIVVFASDNGAVTTNPGPDTALYPGWHEDMPRLGCNYPLRGNKAQLYEGGIRTPAAISWPSVLKRRKLDVPIQVVDWMPTFAALLGIEPSADPQWDGRNIWQLICGESDEPPERTFYWNLMHERFAVRQGAWKLIRQKRSYGWEEELFDLATDPLEERNLAPQQPEIVARLRQAIEDHHALDDRAKRPDVP